MLAHGRVRQLLFGLSILFPLSTGIASGAPITFEFEAVIEPAHSSPGALHLPFQFAEGDIVRGRFTFDAVDSPSSMPVGAVEQPYAFQLTVNGFLLESLGFNVRTFDDLTSDESLTPYDSILLQRLGSFPDRAFIDDSRNIFWTMSSAFGGPSTVLDGADIPPSPEQWSMLLPGSIQVTFHEVGVGAIGGFQASIVAISAIPEPTTALPWFLLGGFGLLYRRIVRLRRYLLIERKADHDVLLA